MLIDQPLTLQNKLRTEYFFFSQGNLSQASVL